MVYWSSPQAWGCFRICRLCGVVLDVFPTGVGVFLFIPKPMMINESLPHRRGGVSRPGSLSKRLRTSSPQAWGCFRSREYSGESVPGIPGESVPTITWQSVPLISGQICC